MGKGRKLAEAQGQEMFGEVICVNVYDKRRKGGKDAKKGIKLHKWWR